MTFEQAMDEVLAWHIARMLAPKPQLENTDQTKREKEAMRG